MSRTWNFITQHKNKLIVLLLMCSFLLILFAIIRPSVFPAWTGFPPQPTNPNETPAKTLWDWLELLIVPILLAVGGILYTHRDKEREIRRQSEDQYQARYNKFVEQLIKILMTEDVEDKKVLQVVHMIILSTLRDVDGKRKRLILENLQDSRLLCNRDYLLLQNADFSGVNLRGINLAAANLSEVKFSKADLTGAVLDKALLSGTDLADSTLISAVLENAVMHEADLSRADLSRSFLDGTQLQGAYMSGVDLQGATLVGANLFGVDYSKADMRGADLTGCVPQIDVVTYDVIIDDKTIF